MSMESALQYHQKIQVLLAHNHPFIDSSLAGNITYVLQGMAQDEESMQMGFNELKFWLSEGVKSGSFPPILYRHLMRYIERGISITSNQGENHA